MLLCAGLYMKLAGNEFDTEHVLERPHSVNSSCQAVGGLFASQGFDHLEFLGFQGWRDPAEEADDKNGYDRK